MDRKDDRVSGAFTPCPAKSSGQAGILTQGNEIICSLYIGTTFA